MQRVLDIVFSASAVALLSPLLIPVAILLRFTGEGEVFYRQLRVGRGGRDFGLLKFATMLKDSPNLGTGTITVTGDPRVLPVGRVLRKTKMNELPQLLNVLKGDMSLIGPRPLTRDTYMAIPSEIRAEIADVAPGLSGIGSVIFRDEESLLSDRDDPKAFHRDVITPYKGALEAWYSRRNGVGLYCLLLMLTVWAVLVPGSRLVWRVFPSLPSPPAELASLRA